MYADITWSLSTLQKSIYAPKCTDNSQILLTSIARLVHVNDLDLTTSTDSVPHQLTASTYKDLNIHFICCNQSVLNY